MDPDSNRIETGKNIKTTSSIRDGHGFGKFTPQKVYYDYKIIMTIGQN